MVTGGVYHRPPLYKLPGPTISSAKQMIFVIKGMVTCSQQWGPRHLIIMQYICLWYCIRHSQTVGRNSHHLICSMPIARCHRSCLLFIAFSVAIEWSAGVDRGQDFGRGRGRGHLNLAGAGDFQNPILALKLQHISIINLSPISLFHDNF